MNKSAIIIFTLCGFLLAGVCGCEGTPGLDDTGNQAKTELLLGVEVLNRAGAYAEVNNPGRAVTVHLTESDSDKTDVRLKVTTADNVVMYDPESSDALYNLETKPEIWVKNNGQQVKFQVVVEIAPKENEGPVVSVEILNKFECTAQVDNEAKIITLSMTPNERDLQDVKMKVTLDDDYSMYSPKTEEAVYNFAGNKKELWIKSGAKQLKYTIKINTVRKREEIDPTTLGWTNVSSGFGTLPTGVTVYKSPARMFDENTIAYVAKVDMDAEGRAFSTLGGYQTGAKTPSTFYASTKATVILNASYFYASGSGVLTTIGLVVSNGNTLVSNVQGSTRNGPNGTPTVYNPTRAVFSMSKSGSMHADWVWSVTADMHYAYPRPADVHPGQAPAKYPDKNYPAGGWPLDVQEGLSAGPLLLRNGEIYNTWEEEIWDTIGGTNATSNGPRSAIGVTGNRQLILFACEGRNITPDTPGLTTFEVANVLKDLGCVDAMNMDGGGSTCLLVNGKETVKPSSNGVQRAVMTAIAIK